MQALAEKQGAAASRTETASILFGERILSYLEANASKQESAKRSASTLHERPRSTNFSAAEALVHHLAVLGVEQAFGVSGGAIALFFDALATSPIALHHLRHESGAAFAATEAYFASGKPSVVFATTGPGVFNALTGIAAARWEGAKIILVSGVTNPAQRGRWATQETSSYTTFRDALYSEGPLFDYAVCVEHVAELPQIFRRLSLGISHPGRFVAHIALPIQVQSSRCEGLPGLSMTAAKIPGIAKEDVREFAEILKSEPFAIWAGFGARLASRQVLELVEASGAKIFCSPRAKGIVPEDHPQYLGVTGIGGHQQVLEYMVQKRPGWVLVLGSRLGEPTSFWDRDLCPGRGFIHVDIDRAVPGSAYPDSETVAVQAEIGQFLDALLTYFPSRPTAVRQFPRPAEPSILPSPERRPVRPQALMAVVQKRVIDGSNAVVLAECGNSMAWCNYYLRFPGPGRYRVSTLFGSMGHAVTGVVGAALARHGKAVAIGGDGSLLMNSEISSAVQYRAQAVWLILNDAAYGMCRDGHRALGLCTSEVEIPRVDFAALARSLGACAVTVENEADLDSALEVAMAAQGPFLIDIQIDPTEPSPLALRFESLREQGIIKRSPQAAGWPKGTSSSKSR